MTTCQHCGETTQFIWDALSHLCISCGIMTDSSQYVLANDSPELNSAFELGQTYCRAPQAVYGQHDKENRELRNKAAAYVLIRSILVKLDYPGLVSRVQTLFDASMAKGGYKWGRRTNRIIGACTFIALRENLKPESLEEVAMHARVEPSKLSNSLFRILRLHELKLTNSDPLCQLPRALRLISDIVLDGTRPLPKPLRTFLSTPSLHSVRNLAASLYQLTNRVFLTHNRATAPVACALVILALEGEARKEVPSLSSLANLLAQEFSVTKEVVVDRYLEMQNLLVGFEAALPWAPPQHKTKRKGSATQRAEHAVLIKDVVEFQEELERKRVPSCDLSIKEGNGLITQMVIEADEDEGASSAEEMIEGRPGKCEPGYWTTSPPSPSESLGLHSLPGPALPLSTDSRHSISISRPSKRPRVIPPTTGDSEEVATNGTLSSKPRKLRNEACPRPRFAQVPSRRARQEAAFERAASAVLAGPLPVSVLERKADDPNWAFRGNILSADPIELGVAGGSIDSWCGHFPSRLEALASLKGERNVTDDELFTVGELEALMRTEDEVEAVRARAQVEGWDELRTLADPGSKISEEQHEHQYPSKNIKRTKKTDAAALGEALGRLKAKRKRQEPDTELPSNPKGKDSAYMPSISQADWDDDKSDNEAFYHYSSSSFSHEFIGDTEDYDHLYTHSLENPFGYTSLGLNDGYEEA